MSVGLSLETQRRDVLAVNTRLVHWSTSYLSSPSPAAVVSTPGNRAGLACRRQLWDWPDWWLVWFMVSTVYKLRVRHMAQPAPQVVYTSRRKELLFEMWGTWPSLHHRSCTLVAEKKCCLRREVHYPTCTTGRVLYFQRTVVWGVWHMAQPAPQVVYTSRRKELLFEVWGT